MAFWNKWPYTNLQNLNLDWILNEIKRLKDEGLTVKSVRDALNSLIGSNANTAKNADKLGGKPPEYYTPAVNLLDNTNFLRFIAQAGVFGRHGSLTYVGDRWRAVNLESASTSENGLTLTSTVLSGYMEQKVVVEAGTQYTFAVKGNGDKVQIAAFSTNLEVLYGYTVGKLNGIMLFTFIPTDTECVVLIYPAASDGGGSATFTWAALYNGTFTAESLPPFVRPDPLTELEKCQYYFRRIKGANYSTFGVGAVRLGHVADFFISVGEMRIDNVSISTQGKFSISVSGGSFDVSAISLDTLARSNHGILIRAETDGDILSGYLGQAALLQANNDTETCIDISADL